MIRDAELLRQCIASGQVTAEQVVAHDAAGDLKVGLPDAQPVIAPEWVMLTEDEMWRAVKKFNVLDLNETGNAIQRAFIAKQAAFIAPQDKK